MYRYTMFCVNKIEKKVFFCFGGGGGGGEWMSCLNAHTGKQKKKVYKQSYP